MSFGHGPFGRGPFGTADWARAALYDALPEPYREASAAQGNYLETWAASLAPSFNAIKTSMDGLAGLVDPLQVRSRLQQSQQVLLGSPVFLQGSMEQGGLRGAVDTFGVFTAPTAKFSSRDVGKILQVISPSRPSNSKSVEITAVLSPNTLETEPILDSDSSLRWSILTKPDTPTDRVFAEVVWAQDMLQIGPSWLLFDGEVEAGVISRYWLSSLSDTTRNYLERDGSDGVLVTGIIADMAVFLSPSARFTWADYGRTVSLPTTAAVNNTRQWAVDAVLDPAALMGDYTGWTGVVLRDYSQGSRPAPTVADVGPLYWAVLKRPVVCISGTTYPRGTVQQSGADLYVTAPGNIAFIPSADLNTSNVGDTITVYGIGGTLDVLEATVTGVSVTAGITTVTSDIALPTGTDARWELRKRPLGGSSKAAIQSYPVSLIGLLGDNYAASVEYKEREHDQRGWIRTASDWSARKGWQAYTYAAKYSGFDPTVEPLYHVAVSAEPVPDSDYVLRVPETGIAGTAGSLVSAGAEYRLAGTTITDRHVGMGVLVTNAGYAINESQYFEITAVSGGVATVVPHSSLSDVSGVGGAAGVDSFTVGTASWTPNQFAGAVLIDSTSTAFTIASNSDTVLAITGMPAGGVWTIRRSQPVAPDYGSSGTAAAPTLHWSVYRLYITMAPRHARFDEVSADAVPIDSIAFGQMDFAWPITITSAAPSGINSYNITATQLVPPVGSPHLHQVQPVASTGRWWVGTDPANKKTWVSTVPVLSGTTLTFAAVGLQPALGASFLVYDAPVTLSCDYGASYRLWVKLSPLYYMEDGLEAECFERAIRRLKSVTPAHAELVVQLVHTTPVPVAVATEIVTP